MRIQLHFEGIAFAEIPDGIEEDSEAYTDAVADAWANISAEDISNAATLTEVEVTK